MDTVAAVALQALLSMEFSRQEYWSGLPFPSPEDLPDPGIEPRSPALQADALASEPQFHQELACHLISFTSKQLEHVLSFPSSSPDFPWPSAVVPPSQDH